MGDQIQDPDAYAVLVVQQFLFEQGYGQALAALERAVGLKFVEDKLSSGSELMQMVYKRLEEQYALVDADEELEQLDKEEEQKLLSGGASDFPSSLVATLEGVFTNVIAVMCWPGQTKVFVGTGDGLLQLLTYTGELEWKTAPSAGSGGILSLDFKVSRECPLVLAGYMDGSVAAFDAHLGFLVVRFRPHRKYTVRVRWLPNQGGSMRFVSASWDNTLAIHTCSGWAAGSSQAQCTTLWAPEFTAAVQDVELLHGGSVLVAAVRASNYLRLLSLDRLQEVEQVNMNALGDDHVSFSACHLAASPCGKYLLVSTDGPRIIMFRLKGWQQVRNFYGLPTEQFHQPCALWHASGFYIMATAAAGHIYVFHVGTAKVVASFKAHAKNARALHYDCQQNVLVTGSFDRTCKVFDHADSQLSQELGQLALGRAA